MRDAGEGVVSLFFPGSQETSKQGCSQDDCSTDDRPARSLLSLYENDPDRVQNRFYDADDCGVESPDMFDRPRVKQIGNCELEDAKQKDPDTVALEIYDRKHPWRGEDQSKDIAQKQDRFWRLISMSAHKDRQPRERHSARQCGNDAGQPCETQLVEKE